MSYTDNLYLKRIAGTLTSPIEGRHTNNYYLKIISKNIGKGGGGSYDDTEIKRRITNVENAKQDKLTAGQNITIDANTIAAREIIDDTINSTTTVWSSKKVKDLIEGLEGGAKVSIVATKPDPSVAEEKTMYYVGTSAPFHIWFFVNDAYTDVGTTDINLENYFTKDEINALLAGKVDKETGKVLIPTTDLAQITTNKTDIADLKEEKQDKITDSTLSTLTDSTTVSSVDSTAKTNKTFALSALWDWIVGKLTSNTEKGIQVSGGKLGHTNAITVPTSKRILQATYDAQGHVTAIENEFNWSNTYNTSAENQLFTRKGAYNLWTAAKSAENNESADVTLTCSSMQNNFVFQKTYARKIANNVYFICFNLYKSSGSVSANTEVKIAGDTTPLKVDGKNINQFVGQAVYVPDSHAISITYNGNTLWAESGGKSIGNGSANNIRVNAIVYTTS